MPVRDLWLNVMHYGEFDRMPVLHWWQWPETRERWRREGLGDGVGPGEYVGASPMWSWVNYNVDLLPPFEQETIEETDEYRIFRQYDGVVCKDWKNRSSIPHFLDYTLKDASGWDEYKKRLQPDPARLGDDLDEQIARAETSGLPVVVPTASLMGWIRNWMGVENMSYLMFDDRDVYADMVNTLAELTCWALEQVLPRVRVDIAFGWEDICGRSGPLVSPDVFVECVAPGYRKIRATLEKYDVPLLGVDCDGEVSALLGPWLDAGVNVQFPVEIGAWKADPAAHRRRFGRELRIIGGIDKLAMEKGPAAIDAEIERRRGLMGEGGFVPMPDHLITPDTSLENYKYYIDRMKALRF